MTDIGVRVGEDMLGAVVRQFSDEMAFLRELVQNGLDAGSAEIDVDLGFDDARGLATVAVADYGEGMTREVIDTRLTRLFASSKEDDFTKIGKFGIGFVSVFAIGPKAVVVDTGRSGESWRILFKPGGTFERIRLAEPVEGTRVTVYKEMTAGEFPDLVRASRETVVYWCRHAQAAIRFNGEAINEPFDVPCALEARASDGFTEVVAGFSNEEKPFFGFYNHGLTLMEGHAAIVPGVTFKIKSRYLEHTLTRDNVKKDASYEKAMKTLQRLVNDDLRRLLIDDLAAAAEGETYHRLLAERAPYLGARWAAWGKKAPIVRAVDKAISLADLERSAAAFSDLMSPLVKTQVVLFEPAPSPLTEALERRGVAVLSSETTSLLRAPLEALRFQLLRAAEVVALAVPLQGPLGAAPRRLLDDAAALLGACKVRLQGVEAVRLEGAERLVERLPVWVQRREGDLVTCIAGGALGEDEAPPRWPMSLRSRGRLLVNLAHPLVAALVTLSGRDAQTAAYALAKAACLADGVHPQMEDRLLAAHHAERLEKPVDSPVAELEACLRTVFSTVDVERGLLDPRVDLEPLGAHGPMVAFKGMRVVLNAEHPYVAAGGGGHGRTFRLASAVFTCYNVALDRVRDEHEVAFLQGLAGWLRDRLDG